MPKTSQGKKIERVTSQKSLAVTNRLYNNSYACKKENCGCKDPTKNFASQSGNKSLNALISPKNRQPQPKKTINAKGKSNY